MTRIELAKEALEQLREENPPRLVLEAAEVAVACAVAGVQPPRAAHAVLLKYHLRQQGQNRYGQ